MLSQLYRRKKKDSNVLVKVMLKERLYSELQDTLKTQLARLEKDLTLKNVEEEVSMYGRGARSRVVRFAEEPVFIGAEELVSSHHYPEQVVVDRSVTKEELTEALEEQLNTLFECDDNRT